MSDCWDKVDVELEKDVWSAGEKLKGHAIVVNSENIKIRNVRIHLRGRAYVEWKIIRSGDWRTVKDEENYLNNCLVLWGQLQHSRRCVDNSKTHHRKSNSTSPAKRRDAPGASNEVVTSMSNSESASLISILPRGYHKFPFEFILPESMLPCSFESRTCQIRYSLRLVVDLPYASHPYSVKYFTLIAPYTDCMDPQYLAPMRFRMTYRQGVYCLPFTPRPALTAQLDRTAYCCGENIKLHCVVNNPSDNQFRVFVRILQKVEYFIHKSVIALTKEIHYTPLEYKSELLPGGSGAPEHHLDLQKQLRMPIVPPTLTADYCKLLQITYTLRVFLQADGKSRRDAPIDFPLVVATIPYRVLSDVVTMTGSPDGNVNYMPPIENVEGGNYVSSQFRLGGEVYDGTGDGSGSSGKEKGKELILYRPRYVCVMAAEVENDLKPSANRHSHLIATSPKSSPRIFYPNKDEDVSKSAPTFSSGPSSIADMISSV